MSLARSSLFTNLVKRSFCTSSSPNITTEVDKHGIATISLNKGPVNTFNMEMIQELTEVIKKTEKSAKGMILTSSLPKVFCGGLDITEMFQPDRKRLEMFWGSFQDMWISLYSCKIPTVAAIAGQSPAGGCVLALSCDYRVMVGPNYIIGLNETQLGMVAPLWVKDILLNTIGHRQTEMALQMGTLFTAEEALKTGLVDKVVGNREECLDTAHTVVSSLASIPSEARHVTKILMRQPTLDKLVTRKSEDVDYFVSYIMQPSVQQPIGRYLQALKKKSKKK